MSRFMKKRDGAVRTASAPRRPVVERGARCLIAMSVAAVMAATVGVSGAYADEARLTPVSDSVMAESAYRVPALDTMIGRGGSLAVGSEAPVAVSAADGTASALVRISVFGAASDADVTMGGTPVLHVAAGHDASTTVLASVSDGAVNLGASAGVNASVEVLACFGSSPSDPGSTVALDAPVTRADTSAGLAASSLSAAPLSVGLVGEGGVPADNVRAAYVTLDTSLEAAGTVTVGGQALALPAGRSIVSTIVVPDGNGNVSVLTDGATGSLTLVERGYVAGAGENLSAANVGGGYVPVSGETWKSASASEGADSSVTANRVDDNLFGIALVSAASADSRREYVEVGESLTGRSHGAVVDAANGALPQLEVVESSADDIAVSALGGTADASVLLLGDVLGEKTSSAGAASVSFTNVKDGDTLDFSQGAGKEFQGSIESDASVESVQVYGGSQLIGSAAVTYAQDGTASWSFFAAAQSSGETTYSVTATMRDGSTAKASVTVTVQLPDSSDTVINSKVVEIPGGDSSPIVALDDSSVTLNAEPTFQVGSIIVSDIAPNAPEGLLRWVDSIDRSGDLWIIGTHQADLTDAFYQVKVDENTDGVGDVILESNDSDQASDVTINEPVDGGNAETVASSPADQATDAENAVMAQDAADGTSDDAVVRMVASSNKQGMTISGVSPDEGETSVQAMPASSDAEVDSSAAQNVSDDEEWIDDTPFDFKLTKTLSDTRKIEKTGKSVVMSARHSDGKLEDRVSASASIGISEEISAGLVVGWNLVPSWEGWHPSVHVEYLRLGAECSEETSFKIKVTGKFEDTSPLDHLELKETFDVGIPVVVALDFYINIYVSIAAEMSLKLSFKNSVQAGYIRTSSDDGGRGYAHMKREKPKIDTDCAMGALASTGSVSLEFSAGPQFVVRISLYEAVGVSGTVHPVVQGKVTLKDSAGTVKLTVKSSIEFLSGLDFDITIPILGKTIAKKDLSSTEVKYTFSWPTYEKVLENLKVCDSTVPTDSDTNGTATPKSSSSSGTSDSSGFVLGDGMVKVTWKDAATGASKTGQLKAGDFFSVSQSAVAAQMGVTPGSLAGMKGVTVHTTLMDYSVANGHSFQVPDDSIVVETYYDDPATEVVDGTTDADVAFVIDTTGSMWDEIADVKNNIEALTNTIHADSPTTRIAYLTYSDCYYANSGVRLVVPFTTETDAVVDGIKNAPFDGGGLEAVYSGLSQAADMDWRQNVKKSIILVGDEPATDPEPNGLTFDTTVAKLKSKDIQVYATGEVYQYSTVSAAGAPSAASAGTVADRVASDDAVAFSAAHAVGSADPLAFALAAAQAASGGDVALDAGDAAEALTVVDGAASADGSYGAQAVNDWGYDWTKFATELSEATGGHFVEYTRDDFVNRLTETVVDAVKRPDVNVELGHSVYTGDQADFTATAVTHQENDPVVSYEWDFGNGQTMTTAPGATASTAYAADGTYSVIVKAVTQSGLVGSTVYQLTVGAHQAPYMYNAHKVVSRSASGVSPVRLDVLNDPGEEFASVAFSNGSDTIAVPGEGAWAIGWDAENGLLEATFAPEAGFTGTETTHVLYTVTNASGLSGTGELWGKYVS